MDIAGIISELLEHQDKLAVPGLGTFYRSRLEGYYSKEQQQFYPPSLQLQFNPELLVDDNVLINALAEESGIGVSTARYNLEKYITNIIQQATTESAAFGDLGAFTMRRSQLVFMPKKLNNNNELFYGLAPVRLRRNRMKEGTIAKPVVQMPFTEKPSAFTAALLRGEPMPGKSLSSVNGGVQEEEEEEPDADGKKPNRINTWVLVIAILILLSGIGLIFAYKYNPALFDRFKGQTDTPPISGSEKKRKREISDSIQNAIQAQKDIGGNPVVDSTTKSKILGPEAPRDTFGIVIGKFGALAGVQKEYDRYKYTGLPVEIRHNPERTANPFQLVVAVYFEADSAKKHLDEFKQKVRLQDIFIQKYPYKKQ